MKYWDKALNAFTGCDPVSPGCDNCYGKSWSNRNMGEWNGRNYNEIKFHPERLQRLSWQTPQRVFVCNMSDIFNMRHDEKSIMEVFRFISLYPQHQFYILTKRANVMRGFLRKHMPPLGNNTWLGVTVENADYLYRIDLLRDTIDHPNKWISFEPLLSSVYQSDIPLDLSGIGWVVTGGETGENARENRSRWASEILSECKNNQIPFLFKHAGWKYIEGNEFLKDSKKYRFLGGREWDGLPPYYDQKGGKHRDITAYRSQERSDMPKLF